jgi:hypothetical protein
MDICRRNFGAAVLGALAASRLQAANRPKLLVLVLLGQLRADQIDDLTRQLGPAGLRYLLEKGAYFPDCRHLASAFPATGIATIATGAWPAQHGIVAGSWYDRSAKSVVLAGREALLATTLASQAGASPRNRVYVVGMEERHAGIFAGDADASVYWMTDRGAFAGNADEPEWVADFNRSRPLDAAHDAAWMAVGARPGAPALRILRYDPEKPEQFLTLYKASPWAQSAQFDFVTELVAQERLGQGEGMDFLCLLDESSTLLGYETGGLSPLVRQLALRLDQNLEALLTALTKALGEGGYSVVLTAAHGAPPEPPAEARERMTVDGEALAQAVNRSLAAKGYGRVEKYVYPFLYLDTSGFRDAEPLRVAAAEAAMELPQVAGYYTAAGACSTYNDWELRYRNSFHAKRSGDVMLSYRPEYIEQTAAERGISYGSIYNYDVRVPLILFGPQFKAGVYEQPVESVDLAPTLARVLGVAAPSSAVGRVLSPAFTGLL